MHGSSMRNELTDHMTLTFDFWTPKTVPLLGYPKIIPYTEFEHFGIICFTVMSWAIKQTDGLENPTHTDRHCRRG